MDEFIFNNESLDEEAYPYTDVEVLDEEANPYAGDEILDEQDNFISPFIMESPAIEGEISTKDINKKTLLNKTIVEKSNISAEQIISLLCKTINWQVIRSRLVTHNQANTFDVFQIGTGDFAIDAVFTEAIRQFQSENIIAPLKPEHVGVLDQTIVDTLGFSAHGLKPTINSKNLWGQKQLDNPKIKPGIPGLTNNVFTAENWFQNIIKPAWLGVRITDGVHVLLYQKLKEAENWLLTQPSYKGMTPVALGKALGFTKGTRYSAARLSAANQAMHGFGLAIDIDVWGNPWIGEGWNVKRVYDEIKKTKTIQYPEESKHLIQTLRDAAGSRSLPGETVLHYLDRIAQTRGMDTRQAYDLLKQNHTEFIAFLKKNDNKKELEYWQKSRTFGKRDPKNGFLNLHSDLVYALRQVAKLAWGAIDFGSGANGDIMHFDMRTLGVGNFLSGKTGGFIRFKTHPSLIKDDQQKELEDENSFEDEEIEELEQHEAIDEGEFSDDEVLQHENIEEIIEPESDEEEDFYHFTEEEESSEVISSAVPSIEDVAEFNQWHAQKIVDSMNAGIIGSYFHAKEQLEKIIRGEKVLTRNPQTIIIQALPVMCHIAEMAKQENYRDIVFGSFIRPPKDDGSCTGHCAGHCIDINYAGGSFNKSGSVQMVTKILQYLLTLNPQFRKKLGFGLPLQGEFFGNVSLIKFKSAPASKIRDMDIRNLIPKLGIVFPDNNNHLHIQVKMEIIFKN